MAEYSDYAGTEIDIATCSLCGRRDIFETQRTLTQVLGEIEDEWQCIVVSPDHDPNDPVVVCPECTTDEKGWVYGLQA